VVRSVRNRRVRANNVLGSIEPVLAVHRLLSHLLHVLDEPHVEAVVSELVVEETFE
jgi:hypothetical protein